MVNLLSHFEWDILVFAVCVLFLAGYLKGCFGHTVASAFHVVQDFRKVNSFRISLQRFAFGAF